jgi:hypothetical protein
MRKRINSCNSDASLDIQKPQAQSIKSQLNCPDNKLEQITGLVILISSSSSVYYVSSAFSLDKA